MDVWSWIYGYGYIGMDVWVWIYGYGCMGMDLDVQYDVVEVRKVQLICGVHRKQPVFLHRIIFRIIRLVVKGQG